MSDDYLATVKSYRAYLDSLPDVTEDDVYCIQVVGEEFTETQALVMAMNDAEAIEALDVVFLQVHLDREKYADYGYVVAVSPVDGDGERRELARIGLEW